ncbi:MULTISPECIES: polysaccharide deacetylase family protein [unclassified Halomonas]|uniref:polysaccharide deacetylase family protein n=1 Tax=unclassified Halomonas TaxID=2609666 RepID=UPI0007D8D8A3|nr:MULTISPECIES: polysaccharide deacetylase family protein [unclassified Halomonas]MBT2786844.1 polysaccharide deacetylase family protein [Halomonas sp. ISL-106]MBT2798503.1 polysaccharide deacetylase family protein [Halomonas sp. ISL-104]OAL58124.1 polysaccharide deacetylase [Halomonas sp. ALS9]
MKESLGVYDYWAYDQRPKITWPGGAKVAFWVAPNIEYYELDPPQNPQRNPWPHPHPSVPGYSIRDYGNRVGHQRQMALLDKYGVRGSVSLSVALCEHHPEIIQMCKERDWEFFSHGIYNTRYTYGLSEDQERAMIRDSMETIHRHTGQACAGYLAPALSHSERTLDLFAEVGEELFGDKGGLYTCDLFHDDQPTPVSVRSGKRFISMPYSLEMNDTIVYAVNKVEPRQYATMLKRHFDRLYAEGAESGTVMCIPTHNYQVSCPHRIKAFEEALEYITGHPDVWVATGREIADYYLANYFDAALDSIAAQAATARQQG